MENTLLSVIKYKLKAKYGGFDESVYGYSKFGILMQEGEALGYFKLGMDENGADFATFI